jgi:hypothetical protein
LNSRFYSAGFYSPEFDLRSSSFFLRAFWALDFLPVVAELAMMGRFPLERPDAASPQT